MSSQEDEILEFATPGSKLVTAQQELANGPTEDIVEQLQADNSPITTKPTQDITITSDDSINTEVESTETVLHTTADLSTTDGYTDSAINTDPQPVDESDLFTGYDEKLQKLHEKAHNINPNETPENPYENFDFDNIEPNLPQALEAKQRGNAAFAKQDYEMALECYSEALLYCPDDAIPERILFHNNKCAAHVMRCEWEDGIFEADCALQLDEKNVKAMTRRAKCYEAQEDYQRAIEDYKTLSEMEPSIRLYQNKVIELTKLNEAKFEKQKEEMLTTLKGWGNTVLGYFGMSTDNFQFTQDPATGSYSMNFVQNPGQPQQPQQSQPPQ